MKKTKRRIAVFLFVCLIVPYLGVPKLHKTGHDIPTVRAETISEETEWNIQYMKAEKTYEESKNLKRIKIAVLDSGLDYDEDIPFVERKDFLGEQELHPIYQDKTGHGTSVAGVICAKKSDDRITGIAANVDLYAGRVLDGDNKAPVDRVIEGIRWAMEKNVDIIHMSYGTQDYDEELEEVIEQAYEQGILLVAAAGNAGTAAEDESTVEYPAAFDNVISVGATNADNKKTEISSSGYELDVVAPGDQILSSGAFGGVVVEEGTSVSAAQVTGVAAVLWGKHPDKSNEFIKGLLVSGANAEAVDENCGNGIIDYEQSKQNYEKMNATYQTYKSRGVAEKTAVEKAEESIGENRKEIRKTDEVNYVNGAWSGNTHSGFVTTGKNINIVKAGAIVPDNTTGMKYMGDHPCFHGKGNYLANTQYIFFTAKKYLDEKNKNAKIKLPEYTEVFKNGSNPYKDVQSVSKYETKEEKKEREKKDIQNQLRKSLNYFFDECKKQNNKKNVSITTNEEKGYALLGAAIHNATDAMSHRACLNVGEKYGGWREVVHDPKAVNSAKRSSCAAAVWNKALKREEQSVKEGNTTYVYDIFKIWCDNLICADNTIVLSTFVVISKNLTNNLIVAAENKNENCYNCFQTAIEDYEKVYRSSSVHLNKLNSYWGQVHKGKGKFMLNADVKAFKTLKPKKADIVISLLNGNLIVNVEGATENSLCSVRGFGNKGKKHFFSRRIKKAGKRNIPYWCISNSKIKTNKVIVDTYTVSQHYSVTVKKNFIVKYSKKAILQQGIETKTVTVKKLKDQVLDLGEVCAIRKPKYKGYKLKYWIAEIDHHITRIEMNQSNQSYKSGKITLQPVLVKEKRKNKKKKSKKGKKSKKKKGKKR